MGSYSEDWGGRSKCRTADETWGNRSKNLEHDTYQEFLNSDYWQSVKERAFNRSSYQQCKICGTKDNIELHHKHYDLIYTKHELHAIIPLCRKHHQEVHDYANTINSSLRYATRKVCRDHGVNSS